MQLQTEILLVDSRPEARSALTRRLKPADKQEEKTIRKPQASRYAKTDSNPGFVAENCIHWCPEAREGLLTVITHKQKGGHTVPQAATIQYSLAGSDLANKSDSGGRIAEISLKKAVKT